jgi:2-methylcitrate dehydratase PrpD
LPRKKYTRELAHWVCALKYEDIPDRVVEECKNQLLSMLGAVYAGSRTASGQGLLRTVRGLSGGGPCSLMPNGDKGSLSDALLANAGLSMALDYDDYMVSAHAGHSAVLAPLAMAQTLDVDGKEFIIAQAAANEVAARLGTSVLLGPLNGQMWSFVHAAGAAVAAGRLLKLDPDQMASALGMALGQPHRPTMPGFMGGDSKLLTAAMPAVQGAVAAHMAANGLSGPNDILEHPEGFCATFSFTPLLSALTSALGRNWLCETLSYKIYPGCAYLDSSMDCLFEILKSNEIDAASVKRVDVHASIMTMKMNEAALAFVRHTASQPQALNFFLPYNISVGIHDGRLTPEQFTPERIANESIWNLIKKIHVSHDIKYTKALVDAFTNLVDLRKVVGSLSVGAVRNMLSQFGMASPFLLVGRGREVGELLKEGRKALQKFITGEEDQSPVEDESLLAANANEFQMAFGARVAVRTAAGTFEFEQDVPYGAAGWNLEEKRLCVVQKFEREAAGVISDQAANATFERILSLETLDAADTRLIGSA